jgi:hypothetical protein
MALQRGARREVARRPCHSSAHLRNIDPGPSIRKERAMPRTLAVATATAVSAAAVLAAPAAAQAPVPLAPARTIVAAGASSAPVSPANRKSNDSIKAAVDAAAEKALPAAIADGRKEAGELAAAAGVTLGELMTISNAPLSPYGPFSYDLGPFGPSRFCGNRTTAVVRTDSTGRRRVVARRTRLLCVVPSRVTQQVTLTYAIT